MPEAGPRSALGAVPRFRVPTVGARIAIGECTGGMLLHLEGLRLAQDIDAMLTELGVPSLPAPGRSAGSADRAILRTGPVTWLAVLQEGRQPPTAGLSAAVGRAFEVVLDMTHAWTRIGITGPMASELLSKGSALDLHRRIFPPGTCAVAAFADFRTILWHAPDGTRFDLFVGRSYAASLWDWLTEASAEYEASTRATC